MRLLSIATQAAGTVLAFRRLSLLSGLTDRRRAAACWLQRRGMQALIHGGSSCILLPRATRGGMGQGSEYKELPG